ncbi:hypothetical protein [Trichlorobacter sp.]|uniref:hypothetical protein n=1 Tax=Trichlorobacter sp. TaxID=2911007 RepID=UPI002A361071|nr:hypothetical protein [Trichlorobacter sp.]MDY0384945.1 hypothetical protein [Trichlorobacter sp.]
MTLFSTADTQSGKLPVPRVCFPARVVMLLQLLLGRAPLRRLSQSLILILLLISPLSFSTDKVTNFTYECPVSAGCSIKDNRNVGIQLRLPPLALHQLPAPATRHAPSAAVLPPLLKLSYNAPSRAPPA